MSPKRLSRTSRHATAGAAPEPLSWFGGELSPDEFLAAMASEGRLVYRWEVLRTYGLFAT